MWRNAIILVVAAVAMAAFDPADQNDFIDDPEYSEEPAVTRDPLRVSDIASLGVQTKDLQGEVEKLLGQPVFHYEDPATAPPVTTPPSTSSQPQNEAQTEKVKEKRESLNEKSEKENRESLKEEESQTEKRESLKEESQKENRESLKEKSQKESRESLKEEESQTEKRESLKEESQKESRESLKEEESQTEKRESLKEKESQERMPQQKSLLSGLQNRAHQQRETQQRDPRKSAAATATPREVEEDMSERSQKIQRKIVSEWSHEAPTVHKSTPGSILELTSTRFRRRPKLKTRSTRYSIKEVVYSIQVPWEAEHPKIARVPGVIESIVAGHDIVQHEGGTRSDSARRQYLLTIPDSLTSRKTHPARPTPSMISITFPYKYTRITQKNPNCTDTYYECLLKCFDKKGYRVNCWWDTTTRAEPARLNFTGLFAAINSGLYDYDTRKLIEDFRLELLTRGYRDCAFSTKPTTTTTVQKPVYYDNFLVNKTGAVMAKCWVCGLLDQGVPKDSNCADNFGNMGNAQALVERSSYRKYCRYLDEVPLWFNKSDPYSVYGTWTGGCSTRWIDLSGLYTQRTCRSTVHPAMGMHFLSRRMEMLELALKDEREGCVVSPMATLVPFSRAISLYARIHICVCAGTFCNRARRAQTGHVGAVILMVLLCLSL